MGVIHNRKKFHTQKCRDGSDGLWIKGKMELGKIGKAKK
jgi:hypothetical protein